MKPTLPVWDRGDPIDAQMLRFTIGEDWLHDRRLVEAELTASRAHAEGLHRAGLLDNGELRDLLHGLDRLRGLFRNGAWTVEPGDEDVHSAVERWLVQEVGEAGRKIHTGRSRNEQVAVDLRLWLRGSAAEIRTGLEGLIEACRRVETGPGALPLPGYTHLRRAMPSSVGDWIGAHRAAFGEDLADLAHAGRRLRFCPLGSGAGFGVPLDLPRAFVARRLGFDGPEEPVTGVQQSRGRAELAWLTALEGVALDLGKLAADLWLFSSVEFGFLRLPLAFTTGSSLMPQKRNPDLLELARAHCRQVVADRSALRDVLRDLPSGYHRDFQLLKPPLFRAHDRMAALLPLMARFLPGLEWNREALQRAACDPALQATARVLERARRGQPFRDAYREESRRLGGGESSGPLQPPR